MRKRFLSTALGIGLALGIGFAAAQTVNKALQLSQDATGAFYVDSFLGVNFPGHIFSNSTGQRALPTISGNSTPSLTATDTAGIITLGSTTATVTFGTAYGSVPNCLLVLQTGRTTTPIAYTLATTSIAIATGVANDKINFWCSSLN